MTFWVRKPTFVTGTTCLQGTTCATISVLTHGTIFVMKLQGGGAQGAGGAQALIAWAAPARAKTSNDTAVMTTITLSMADLT